MNIRRLWSILRYFLTFIVLFVLWLAFTYTIDMYTLLSGLIGSLIISFFTFRIFIPEHDASRHFLIPRPIHLLKYLGELLYLMYSSSISMLVTIVKKNPNPRIVHFRTHLQSDIARMVIANSITFTPGTITLDLNDDHLTVHWFSSTTTHSRAAGDYIKGAMEKILLRVWR